MCDNQKCGVHSRVNVRTDVTDEFETGSAFTYEGEYCIATLDNPGYSNPMAALVALLGGEEYKEPGMFMTLVVKVGDRPVGDLSGEELDSLTVHREEFVFPSDPELDEWKAPDEEGNMKQGFSDHLNEIFHDKHDETVLAVQGGLIS